MIRRRKTHQIKVGSVRIGGGAPVSIQSMTKCPTQDVAATVAQIKLLEAAGCEVARVAVKDFADAASVRAIKRKIRIPLVCDIHFNYRLALVAIAAGADKIRLNPGNMTKREEIASVVKAAKKAGIPIRVGVNSGSAGSGKPDALVRAASSYIKTLEALDFHDIIISLKASDAVSTVEAYRKMSALCDYPLHLGVTAAGPYESAVIKSAVGIGALLVDGIGDTVRVSLTADPVEEVIAAKRILSAAGVRHFGMEIVSCPTCGRCQVDLGSIVREVERRIARLEGQGARVKGQGLKVAIMGCEVNGPGEAREADIGIAAGKGAGTLFIKGKAIRRVKEKDFVATLLREIAKFSR